jgi:hypothetical protein
VVVDCCARVKAGAACHRAVRGDGLDPITSWPLRFRTVDAQRRPRYRLPSPRCFSLSLNRCARPISPSVKLP